MSFADWSNPIDKENDKLDELSRVEPVRPELEEFTEAELDYLDAHAGELNWLVDTLGVIATSPNLNPKDNPEAFAMALAALTNFAFKLGQRFERENGKDS